MIVFAAEINNRFKSMCYRFLLLFLLKRLDFGIIIDYNSSGNNQNNLTIVEV